MKIKLNRKQLEDKILGCWIGKNIGGTMGGPYEGTREMLDITGYSTPKGEPLPNDDLDLQLVWLRAMEQVGPYAMSANILGEYWQVYITPRWNEYGIGKSNLNKGLLPPLCGEFRNAPWKHSNGAWIRSEVWACMAPGFPNIAIKYAIMDACIDHGISEGTYAEIFTTALQSIAFVENDIRTVVEKALGYIDPECRVAKCVRLVLEEYDKQTPYRDVRKMLVEQTADLGWFQAPANVGFTVIGLIYGEGDFKKSMIYAINCGDDTDCTAATCGAVLGIVAGIEGIPQDWKEYIGDRIITICINGSYQRQIAKTCTELTERVMEMIPSVLKAHDIYMEYTDEADEYDREKAFGILKGYSSAYMRRSPYSFDVKSGYQWDAVVEYEKEPVIKPGEEFKIRITLKNRLLQPYHVDVEVHLPEGWSAEYRRTTYIDCNAQYHKPVNTHEITLTAGEKVCSRNNVVISVTSPVCPMPLLIPISLLG